MTEPLTEQREPECENGALRRKNKMLEDKVRYLEVKIEEYQIELRKSKHPYSL